MMTRKAFGVIATAGVVAIGTCSALAQDYSETFESYANGTILDNVNGWKGWDNVSGVCGSVTNESAHGGTKSVRIENTDDAVHPFDPPYISGAGTISQWVNIPSNEFFADGYCIYESVYNDGGPYAWVLEIQFDFDGSGGQGPGTVVDDFRPESNHIEIQFDTWVEVRIDVDIDADTCTTYYDGVQLSTGALVYNGGPDHQIQTPDLFTVGATLLYDDINITGLSTGGAEFTLDVASSCPNSGPATLTATNGSGGNVAFIYSNRTGSFRIPNNYPTCPGTQLGLGGTPTLLGTARGNPAVFRANAPSAACDRFWLQALDVQNCNPSNVVQFQ